MKNILFIASFICTQTFSAQQLSDYKYVYVPQNINEFENNKYQLNSTLVKKLKEKGYEVLQEVQGNWPDELKQDPCKVANINLINTGNFFKNRLTFEAKDCNGKVLLSNQGKSNEKDFDLGYMESLQKSLVILQPSAPTEIMPELKVKNLENKEQVSKSNIEAVEKPKEITTIKSEENSTNKAQNYSNGNLVLQKILIGNGQFILLAPNTASPYATFRESTKIGVFRVSLADGSMTLGYSENENYVIELPNKDGSFRKEIFEKK
jgi:hypothetical protein